MLKALKKKIVSWMIYEHPHHEIPLCDFERMRYELRSGDVILVEGRSRVSEVIRQITQSPWSHACLYIGRIHDIEDPELREKLLHHTHATPSTQLVIEGYLGKGTIASPLENYTRDHIRICRPTGLSRQDGQHVINYAIRQLGKPYNLRQFIDLGRFLLPWGILPRRWRSTLFEHHVGEPTKTVCSTMIAEAFATIDFPILPVVKHNERAGVELFVRNPQLFTPRDFDYSPYFEIIKYPFVSFDDRPYRKLPWNREGYVSVDGKSVAPTAPRPEATDSASLFSMISMRFSALMKRKIS